MEIRQESLADLGRYAQVPSAFEALSVLDVSAHAAGFELAERSLCQPFRKDYDLVENPRQWRAVLEPSRCALFAAYEGPQRLGGAIAVRGGADTDLLQRREDLLLLWDLRVARQSRRTGIGSALFQAVERWGAQHNCRALKVETQNTNVAACRFYARQGCRLDQANHGAYARFPEEIQLFWIKAITV